jgi:hypothetical protein
MFLQTVTMAALFVFFYNNINITNLKNINYKKLGSDFINFLYYIFENNPLILDYYEDIPDIQVIEDKKEILDKFENKYLTKFNNFPNEYYFDAFDLKLEQELCNKVKSDFERDRMDKICKLEELLMQINDITNEVIISEDGSMQFNEYVKTSLLDFYNINSDSYDESFFDNLYLELLVTDDKYKMELHKLKQNEISDEEVFKHAHELTIKAKLDKYINNYILEPTPLGNIYMRYNSEKGSFEYFSNSTIPYRYLEVVGRKYVMTYWCKPIFVSLEDELKRAEEEYDEKKKISEGKAKEKVKTKDNIVKFKNYNKETLQQKIIGKNNNILPSHMRANIVNVNRVPDKILLKENANRYTWSGRISDFCPLKKVDKKMFNKLLHMTYSDFKKISQNKR